MKKKLTIKSVLRAFWTIFFIAVAAAILIITDLLPVSNPLPLIYRSGSTLSALSDESDTIKWVDFDVSYEALKDAMKIDIDTYGKSAHVSWIDTLAYLGARYGGSFSSYKSAHANEFAERVKAGESINDITKDMKYFSYYQKAYGAVLGGFLGEFNENGEEKYGLKAFSPVASGYYYTHYDDFGAGRSYGYNRKHFGHDLMVNTGTPIIAVESGIVEAVGWNQYGGWRIGIRSYDGLRYYYYAHLRKDHPYNDRLYEGMTVTAGDVIGYSGQTGYSIKENVNNIDTPHLHYGMQLIFDEAEKDSPNQIWVDMYALTKLLSEHKSEVQRPEGSKEYYRAGYFSERSYYRDELLREESEKLHKYYELQDNIVLSDANAGSNEEQFDETATAAAQEEGIRLPILMYHALVSESKYQNTYFIDPSIFEADLKYLKDNGYTTIVVADLIAYTEQGTPLPEKPVMLTFDDGYYNNYLHAYSLLQKYGMKAVISPVGKLTDEYSIINNTHEYYAYLNWDRIREMSLSGTIEIQNHTYDLHHADGAASIKRRSGESDEAYTERIQSDFLLFQTRMNEIAGITPTAMVYPYGTYNQTSEKIARELGFKATMTCREGINYITRDPECLFRLKRQLRAPGKSIESFL